MRTLAPLADPRSQSPAESITRLRWYDAATPYPDLQVPVNGPGGLTWYLDLGVRELYFAVEYDGEQWHDSPAQRRRDERRRRWIATNTPWTLKVVRRHHVFGKQQSLDVLLPQWIADAKRTLGQRLIRHARRQSG